MDEYHECEKCFGVTAYIAFLPSGAAVCLDCKQEYEESEIDRVMYMMEDR